MARFQYAVSAFLLLGCLFGFLWLGRLLFVGKDMLTWTALGFSFLFAWAARSAIVSMPVDAEAEVRLATAPRWRDLPVWRHYLLWWSDWPLYDAIREREAREMFAQPSVCVEFGENGLSVCPLDKVYQTRYFLKQVALRVAGTYPINYLGRGWIAYKIVGSRVTLRWRNPDRRAWKNFQETVGDRSAVAPRTLAESLEAGYLSTLSDSEKSQYWEAFR